MCQFKLGKWKHSVRNKDFSICFVCQITNYKKSEFNLVLFIAAIRLIKFFNKIAAGKLILLQFLAIVSWNLFWELNKATGVFLSNLIAVSKLCGCFHYLGVSFMDKGF